MATRARYPRATTHSTDLLGNAFWALANDDEGFTERREPRAVVRHAVASIRALQTESPGRESEALLFLVRLEHEPHYASPEQSRGGDKTSRSLVYSIGVLLFERLTGHHPFVVSFSPMQAAIMRDATADHGTGPLCHVPADLRAILNRAMSAFPHDRYADVAELRAALEDYLGAGRKRRRPRATPPPCPHSTARRLFDSRPPTPVEHANGSMVGPVPEHSTRGDAAAQEHVERQGVNHLVDLAVEMHE